MRKPKILFIDDEPSMILVMGHCFPEYEVFGANTPEKGISILNQDQGFGLLLINNSLSSKENIDILPLIKASHPALGVIVVSADGGVESECTKQGADAFFTKPFMDIDCLATTMSDILSKKSL